jgi:hypothetical protein
MEQFSFTDIAEPLQEIIVNGVSRKLAALKPSQDMMASARRFGDTHPVLQSGQWRERDLSFVNSPLRNQQQNGSCTGHAGVTAFDTACRQVGWVPPLLSCTFPYAQVNGGQDKGASVSSILAVLQQLGTCLDSECGTDQIFKQQIPQSAYTTAKSFMAEPTGANGAFLVRSFEEICSALTLGFPVAFGIRIGQNFNQLSQDGICPPPNMVIGGHALCAVGLKRYRNTWIIKFQNSWGPQWGMNGFAYLTQASFDQMVDAYAIVVPRESVVDKDQPPPVKEQVTVPDMTDILTPAPPVLGAAEPKAEEKHLPAHKMTDRTMHIKREAFNLEFFGYETAMESRGPEAPIRQVGPFELTAAEKAHIEEVTKSAK